MSACSQCGTVVKPTDKFCNVCGSPIARPPTAAGTGSAGPTAGPSAGPAAYAATAVPPTYGSERERSEVPYAPTPAAAAYPSASQGPARCQMGHEIAPGGSYCAQGHPIALDQMQFANDPYAGGYGGQPQGGYGGQPQGGYAGQPQGGGYGGQPQGGYAAQPQAQDYAPQARPGAFPTPPPPAASPYGTPGGGGSGGSGGYAPPANQAAYAAAFAPPARGGYAPAPQQPGAYAPAPPPYAPSAAPGPAPAQPAYGEAPARVLRGFLVAYGTNANGDFWPLTAGRQTVGRFGSGDGLDIPLQDPTISSRHAVLVVDGPSGSVGIEDTGSTNGTFVNDEHIGYGGRRELRDGDRIRFGGFTTVVKVIGRV
jgi:hypothetical protein